MSDDKIMRTMIRIKCGAAVMEACKAEGVSPPVLYRSAEYKAYKADITPEQLLPGEPATDGSEESYIRIVRLAPTGDPRDPLFKVETKYAGEAAVGQHFFGSVQAMLAQLPQLTFGLTP